MVIPKCVLFILLFVMETVEVLFGSSRLAVRIIALELLFCIVVRVEVLLMGRYLGFVLFGNLLLQPTALFK